MVFFDNGRDQVSADYTVPAHYQSYPGIVHGGILAAMLDEVVARVAMIEDHDRFMMTARLGVRYRNPVPTETPLKIVGEIIKIKGRLGKARGTIRLPDNTLACEAEMALTDIPTDLLTETVKARLGWRID